jgi:hypothetical protein
MVGNGQYCHSLATIGDTKQKEYGGCIHHIPPPFMKLRGSMGPWSFIHSPFISLVNIDQASDYSYDFGDFWSTL